MNILFIGKNSYIQQFSKYFINQQITYQNTLTIDSNSINNYDVIIIIITYTKLHKILQDIINTSVNKNLILFSNLPLKITNSLCEFHQTLNAKEIITTLKIEYDDFVLNTKNIVKPLKKTNDLNIIHKSIFFDWSLEILPELKASKIPEILQNLDKEAVLVEYRSMQCSESVLLNCILKLGAGWSYTIICGDEAYLYYLKMTEKIHQNIKVINTGHKNMDQNIYNNLLLDKTFWNLLTGEKILIYQTDSFIFKDNIDDFLKWDYIGAPFSMTFLEGNNVGNGGLSLRSKSKMLQVLDTVPLINTINILLNKTIEIFMFYYKLENIPEDIYFSNYLQKLNIGRVADFETAKQFSSDTIWNKNSFGMHCMWNGNKKWLHYLKENSNIKYYQYKNCFDDYKIDYFINIIPNKKTLVIIACHLNEKFKFDILKNNLTHFNKSYIDIIILCSKEDENKYDFNLIEFPIIETCFIENNKLADFGKWYYYLQNNNLKKYENVIFTNDSIIITNNIDHFLDNALHKNVELYGFNDSLQIKYHYQSFLFSIKVSKLNIFIELIEKYKNQINNYTDLIDYYEFGLTTMNVSKDCYFKISPFTNGRNLQFTADEIYKLLLETNLYPIIKVKRLYLKEQQFINTILQKINLTSCIIKK
jgi:hypothetical protein